MNKKLNDYKLKLKEKKEKTNHKSCIIIGANPSIMSKKLGLVIDEGHDFVIRLNREPEKKYEDFYGSHTDVFIGF